MKNYWLAFIAACASILLCVGIASSLQSPFNPNMFKRDGSGHLMVTCRATPAPSDKRVNGFYVDASGNLIITNCAVGTPVPTPTPVPTSTATPTNPGNHVHTVAYGCGYNGINCSLVSIASQAQYLDYAYQGADNTQYQANGIKTIAYTNFWLCYPTDNPRTCYYELAPQSACQANAVTYGYSASNCTAKYTSQAAQTCGGAYVKDNNYGGGYLNGPYISTTNFANIAHDRTGVVSENYVFSDDTAVNLAQSPCNTGTSYSPSQWITDSESAMAAVTNAQVGAPMFANLLNAEVGGLLPTDLANITVNTSTIVGGMAENAYVGSGGAFEALSSWTNDENACIIEIQGGKICWIYSSIGTTLASNSNALRLYAFASYLLTYNQPFSMFEYSITGLTDTFPVMPEEALVPVNPVQSPNTIADLANGGGYFRQWNDCFWDGNDVGACAAAVNPNASGNMTVPTAGYTHAMVIPAGTATSDWAAGGLAQVSLAGSVTSTLLPHTAEILFP